jgi:hypothetical protein
LRCGWLSAFLFIALAAIVPPVSECRAGEAYQTRYATINYPEAGVFNDFEKGLRDGPGLFMRAHGPSSGFMAEEVDRIFEKVEFYLDMYPKKVKIKLELLRDRRELEQRYASIGMQGPAPAAFFSKSARTVYVNTDDVNKGMLAHEFAHAVICAYFNNEAPAKTQEILAQHVDQQIKSDF